MINKIHLLIFYCNFFKKEALGVRHKMTAITFSAKWIDTWKNFNVVLYGNFTTHHYYFFHIYYCTKQLFMTHSDIPYKWTHFVNVHKVKNLRTFARLIPSNSSNEIAIVERKESLIPPTDTNSTNAQGSRSFSLVTSK